MRKAISVVLFLAMTIVTNSSTRADVSRSGVLFLRIAAGARAAGMGEAFVAISDDASATHWNPAGLGLYPLTSTFLEYPLPSGFKAKSIALLRNDIPEINYKRYDIWAISDLDLVRLSRDKWSDYENYSTSFGESVESIIRKYSQEKDEERIKKMVQITASSNNSLKKDSLEALKKRVLGKLSSGSESFRELASSWEVVLEAWDECHLNSTELLNLAERIDDFLSDDSLSSEEADQISPILSPPSPRKGTFYG
jgi:hypothetical protein